MLDHLSTYLNVELPSFNAPPLPGTVTSTKNVPDPVWLLVRHTICVSDSVVISQTDPSIETSFPVVANPVPVIVMLVPPPDPPEFGLTPRMEGVNEVL